MELELRQDYISCWENGYHTTMYQEETMEMIVPDACPDILQILDGEGRLLLQRKEPMDGKAEFSGTIKVTILYQPDGAKGVCSMEATVPFAASAESGGITRRSKLVVTPQVQAVDIHLLNPRKILIKVNYSLATQCYTAQSIQICPGVEESESNSIQQKVEDYQSYFAVAALEKLFNYSDVLTLPAGRPDMKELLRTRASCALQEAKVIGNKLVFKGEAQLELLYRSIEEELHAATFHLPFSQIMECGEVGEEAVPELKLLYTDVSLKPGGEDGRTLSVDLELMAQGVLKKTESAQILTDLYSTEHETKTTRKAYPLCRLMDQGIAPESVREVLETGMQAQEIIDTQVRPIALSTDKQDGELALNAEVEVYVLFATEEGGMDSLHRRFIVVHPIPISDQWEYDCDFWISRAGTATPVGAGIEVAFTLEFRWMAMEMGAIQGIGQVNLEEKIRPIGQERPSVTIRAVQAGDTLWEIAKAYGTTVEDIVQVNSLPTTEIYPGQMLIIPKIQDQAS